MSEIRFGGYRITGTVGSGAVSTIYKAVQEPLGRGVALKVLKEQIAATSSFGEQLDRESKILADIAHPNVVLLLDAGRADSGRPYLVLEWIDGPSLEQLLTATETRRSRDKGTRKKALSAGRARVRALDVSAALAIACGICAALEHIHERGIVHRDVKPSNVLISRTGHVKVIDFGIAQRPRTASMSDTLGTEGITASGRMVPEQLKDAFGTPAYMSPEQILGDFVDGRSDLFSLGVVLYQMLSGTRPFETPGPGDGKRSAAQRIRRDAPAPLRERAPHCPRAVERIVMRLLEKSPNDRYPSAGAVKERLESALRAETREDPAELIRQALAVAKLGPTESAEKKPQQGPVRRQASSPRIAPRSPIGVGRALIGFVVIAVAFVVGVIANEGRGAEARDGRAAGSRALELAPERAGGLRVVATPWAHVRVDGQLVETTPFARAIPLGAGKHFVTLTHPDAPVPIEREIEIVAGEIVTLDVTMTMSSEDAGKDAR
jgi:eukaryotic-like serine/threonine-protein kinase